MSTDSVSIDTAQGRDLPRWHGAEIVVVVMLAVGMAAVRSVVSFAKAATAPAPIATQRTVLNGSAAPGQPWIDLAFQLIFIGSLLLPVLLVSVFLVRANEGPDELGVSLRRWRADLGVGLGIAAAIGGSGLVLYLVVRSAGGALNVVPTSLPDVWWRIPVLIMSACANSALEEIVLVGYLLRRLDQRGWSPNKALLASALIRGLYHFYQGFAGLVGNVIMGAIFARWYQRTGRLLPLLIAHAAIDIGAFVGYVLLAGKVSWLPS